MKTEQHTEAWVIGATALFAGPLVDARDPQHESRAGQEVIRLGKVVWDQLDQTKVPAVWADRHDGLVYTFEADGIATTDLLHRAGALVSAALEAMADGADRAASMWCWQVVIETCDAFDDQRVESGLPRLFVPWAQRFGQSLTAFGELDSRAARRMVDQHLHDIAGAIQAVCVTDRS